MMQVTSTWHPEHRFKKTAIEKFPKFGVEKSEDAEYWKHLKFPTTVQEIGAINDIDICPEAPFLTAISSSAKVQVYNPDTNEVDKSFTKFREAVHSTRFRPDGKLLCSAMEDGAVKLYDYATKTLLRSFSGHTNATHRCDFVADNKNLVSFSDDKTVRLWDVSTEKEVAALEEHKDYIRAGCVSLTSPDIFVSGSYDHTVRVWDRRTAASSLSMDHGCPVEDVRLFPNGSLLASAGGQEIRIWDLIAGGRLLAKIAPHNKTITCLGFARDKTRIVSSSLDRQVKFHDMSTFRTTHSVSFPTSVLRCAVAPDDSFVIGGMSDGLVQFLHRKVPPSLAEIEEQKLRKRTSNRYLQFTDFSPQQGDIIVKQEKREKELRHDFFLRKFEYRKALNQVLKPYVQRKHPEYTYSVLQELQRRNGLEQAIGGRDEDSLLPLLQYVNKHIGDPRFSRFLMEVTDVLLDLYGDSLGDSPKVDRMFVDIRKRMDREVHNLRTLMELQGTIDLILDASRGAERPSERIEEVAARKFRETHVEMEVA